MEQLPITFFSEGHRLDGDLYLPVDGNPAMPLPGVITCSGYQGLKQIHPARFARAWCRTGMRSWRSTIAASAAATARGAGSSRRSRSRTSARPCRSSRRVPGGR